MKATMINTTHIEGLLYQHALTLKTSGENSKNPGTQFINGTIDIATDDACLNIVSVHFTYVTAKTKTGSSNATFDTLQNIINGTLYNVMEHGMDRATKLRIDSAVGLNEFYSNRSGTDELVSVRRNEGGFVHVTPTLATDEKLRNTFKCDMVITGARRIEADEERNRAERVIVKGYIFDFRKALLPVEFTALSEGAMNYFENLEASEKNPCFTQVWGRQISQTVVNRKVTASAFGDPSIEETTSTQRDFIITGGAAEPYVWDDPSTITAQEFKTAMQDREVAVAEIKRRQDEYRASQGGNTNTINTAAAPSVSGFNF